MKLKSILTTLLFMAGLQTVMAQKVVLHMAENKKFECSVSKLDSITFVDAVADDSDVHEWVDLGLPSGTLWATCNVGASKPEEYGDYFAWGEIEPQNNYEWSTYKYCKGDRKSMTKYCIISDYGTVDNKTELEPSDDAATMNWGSAWQMPSYEQLKELVNSSYTSTKWITLNGIYVRQITSLINGNSIYLPAAGYRDGTILSYAGSIVDYWSRSICTSENNSAYNLYFYDKYIFIEDNYRHIGLCVRPVRVMESIPVSSIELNQTELTVRVGQTLQLTATVKSENATNKVVVWSSSDTEIAKVDQTGKVVALAPGTCTITCSATDGSGVKAECLMTLEDTDYSGTLNGHDYVDLVLPSGTLWATCNVGANSPEEYGDYFAWGETEPKSDYSWSTYKYCNGTENTITKYCAGAFWGTIDNLTELEPSDDAAIACWGIEWQMPSLEQCNELINSSYTTTTWTNLNGVQGMTITSKCNGNSIFLPAAGYQNATSLNSASNYGEYWSRSLLTGSSIFGSSMEFRSNKFDTSDGYRYYGLSVRPVRAKESIAISNIELSRTELTVWVGEISQLSATILPENATKKAVAWASSNVDIATVDQVGKVTAVADGTCTITCSATDGSGVKATCQVTVEIHEYVDLGLPSGTLWATCNVGANSPEEYGDYFAWGETAPKSNYSWSTYKYSKGTYDTMTKYCTDSYYGTVDNKTVLEPSDDAATANWGSNWQMPSREQCAELINSSYTTTTWTTFNGVYGRKITSNSNGNSIFLPAAGYRDATSLYNAGIHGSFLSHSLNKSSNESAYSLYFNSNIFYSSQDYRYSGRSVRPVRVKK